MLHCGFHRRKGIAPTVCAGAAPRGSPSADPQVPPMAHSPADRSDRRIPVRELRTRSVRDKPPTMIGYAAPRIPWPARRQHHFELPCSPRSGRVAETERADAAEVGGIRAAFLPASAGCEEAFSNALKMMKPYTTTAPDLLSIDTNVALGETLLSGSSSLFASHRCRLMVRGRARFSPPRTNE